MDLIDWQAFHFLRPLALIGLAPALLLAAWYGLRHLGRGAFDFLLSKELQAVLLSGGETSQRWRTPAMIALGLGLGCIAIAGPTWQRQDMPAREVEDALVVLFDLSLSMYAEDVQPSRLERARLELTDLLRLREEGTTALVAYAGDAHVVTPLTDDVETILHLSVSLSPDIMPVFGSRTGRAIELANQLLLQASQETGRLLLISDGIRGLKSASDACDSRFPPVNPRRGNPRRGRRFQFPLRRMTLFCLPMTRTRPLSRGLRRTDSGNSPDCAVAATCGRGLAMKT